jgi:hypothetical protein
VPQEVRLTPPELVDDFVVIDDEVDAEPEQRLELVFFLRTWALSHPDLAFDVQDGA